MLMSIPIEIYISPNMVIISKRCIYILSPPYGIPSFKGVPDYIQLDY